MNFVVTLAERDYFYGACVLYNSLVVNGFEGIYVVGYRNPDKIPVSALMIMREQASNVRLIELDTKVHFTNYKPAFMKCILDSNPDCSTITYIDPDIVVNTSSSWLMTWCRGGPAVCADVNWLMSPSHPTRRQWVESTGIVTVHNLDFYFNGGFLSLLRSDSYFLDLWQHLILHANCETPLDVKGEIGQWRFADRSSPFMALDQDALNIALMAWEGDITTLGPDVMGFAGAALMPHGLGTPKSWQKNFLLRSLQGRPPREVDKLYWVYANSFLPIYPNLLVILKKFSIKLSSFIGRFYRSS